ncbi:hypothetical protein [Porphyromonas sp.]|nr:hypothetical protein [Porphyromonas sp.]
MFIYFELTIVDCFWSLGVPDRNIILAPLRQSYYDVQPALDR